MLSMDDFRFFIRLATSTSMAAAARALDVTPPAVSQRLTQLEERLGVRLVQREKGRMVLTDEGELLAERGRLLLDEAEAIAGDLRHRRSVVSGQLRIAAPFGFGRRHVAPLAAAFMRRYPDVTLSLTLMETVTQPGADNFDLLVHIGALRDSGRVLIRIAPNDRVLCASPGFMRGHRVNHPRDLPALPCLALRENDEDVTLWRFSGAGSARESIRIKPALSCNDGEVVRSWALAGCGVAVRSEWDVAVDLRSRRLVHVLPAWRLPPAEIVVLVGQRNARVERTQRFIAALREALQPPPWRTKVS